MCRLMNDTMFSQMLNAFQVLRAQTNEVKKLVKSAQTIPRINVYYNIFLKIFNVTKDVNLIYGLQVVINSFSGILFLIFYMFDITTSVENIGIQVFLTSKVNKWAISASLSVCYVFLCIYEQSKLQDALRDLLVEFEIAEERLKIPANPYIVACRWLEERIQIIFQSYWLSNDRRTIFKVSFKRIF